jgi:tetratricopeptide (TPR) repeat protein
MGQFVWPKAEDHTHEAAVYHEDPFITKYRTRFFAVFHGDVKTFHQAFGEIQEMVNKDPKDARALVWLGNGQTVQAGLLYVTGKKQEGIKLLETSRETMKRAVSLKPDDYGIYMMQAATLYIQGQYWPPDLVPRENWETLRDDCQHLIRTLGPRIKDVSVHVRGETYGELGVSYLKLGDTAKAKAAFKTILELAPNTDYADQAKRQLSKLPS